MDMMEFSVYEIMSPLLVCFVADASASLYNTLSSLELRSTVICFVLSNLKYIAYFSSLTGA